MLKGMALGTPMVGIAADGTAKLVLRLTAPSDGAVSFALVDQNGQPLANPPEDGSLTALAGTHTQNLKAFALYDAPSQFVRTGVAADANSVAREVFIQTTLTPDTGGAQLGFCNSIHIVRPPVILVHGLWSFPSTWTAVQNQLQTSIPGLQSCPQICKVDYSTTHADHFSTNRFVLSDEISNAVQRLRTEQQIAAVQADVIGHSLGGILSRLWAGDPQYAQNDNFGMGTIHTLITLDTPHLA